MDKFPRSNGFHVEMFSTFLGTHSIGSIIIGVVKEGWSHSYIFQMYIGENKNIEVLNIKSSMWNKTLLYFIRRHWQNNAIDKFLIVF